MEKEKMDAMAKNNWLGEEGWCPSEAPPSSLKSPATPGSPCDPCSPLLRRVLLGLHGLRVLLVLLVAAAAWLGIRLCGAPAYYKRSRRWPQSRRGLQRSIFSDLLREVGPGTCKWVGHVSVTWYSPSGGERLRPHRLHQRPDPRHRSVRRYW